jgi:DNA-binding transcriptional ArsR family regulator
MTTALDAAEPPRMDDETVKFAVGLFGALAHPTRLRIVELLTERERTVNEVAEALSLLQPNASQHLAILHRIGVVKVTREGAQRCYSLRGPRIPQILRLVNEFRSIHAHVLQVETNAPDLA